MREAYVAPRDAVEEVVAGLWAEVLGLEAVGVNDDFFELGGHSLLVMQAISRIRDMFQLELPPSIIFDINTVARLSEAIRAREAVPGQVEKIADILVRLEGMSEEDAYHTLQQKSTEEVGV
jgi:acyl carrier protein